MQIYKNFLNKTGGREIFIEKTKIMKNIKLFETVSDYTEARGSEYIEPWVSYVRENEQVNYNKSEYEKLLETPLTFEITGDGNIVWVTTRISFVKTIEYKKNSGEWVSIRATTGTGVSISVVSGDTVQFRGNNATYYDGENDYFNSFCGTTAQFNVYGNIMSLINSTNFASLTTFTNSYNFAELFSNCTGLTSAGKLILPATTLRSSSYQGMFRHCINLITIPELPATTLANGCYTSMFVGCTSLTKAPQLPATTLVPNCYYDMFRDCTSLTTAPELPVETLANWCYYNMFHGCTSLTIAPSLPATTLATYCYVAMFAGCTGLTSAPELPAMTLAGGCYQSMFNGCTSLTTAPELPAETLADNCYISMFQNCTSLTSAPELPATTLTRYCYNSMFNGCTSLTTAPQLPATTLAQACYQTMFRGCTNLNYIKCLATDISASNSHTEWVSGVQTTSGTFVKAAGITTATWGRGEHGIPFNWTVQDA